MNMRSLWHFKLLYGYDLINQYHPKYNQAKDLYDEYCAYIDTFKTGDEYELLEYFADSLQFPYYTLMDEDEYRHFKFKGKEDKVSLNFTNDKGMEADDVDVAKAKFALDHQDGSDATETTMLALHMLSALEYFDGIPKADVKSIAIEIAMVGVNGIDLHSKYTLKSIPNKEFSGYKLLAYYYVSWAIAIPEMLEQLQLPFTKAYDIAKALYAKGERDKE